MTEPQSAAALHPDIAVLAPLLGTWRGSGQGEYPTIAPFDYVEEVTFGHLGRPFLTYTQRTRSNTNNRPLHGETGYIRCAGPNRAELIVAHPTGITEVCEGPLIHEAGEIRLELGSSNIGLSSTAKPVTALDRTICQRGDTIVYTLCMAAVEQTMQQHLNATLQRV